MSLGSFIWSKKAGTPFGKSLMAPSALPCSAHPVWVHYQLNSKWMCTCFQQAYWTCECPLSTQRTDSDWSVKDSLCMEHWARGLSLKNVRTLEKQQQNSHILYLSVQLDTAWTCDWVWGWSCYSFLLPLFSSGLDLLFLFLLCRIFV